MEASKQHTAVTAEAGPIEFPGAESAPRSAAVRTKGVIDLCPFCTANSQSLIALSTCYHLEWEVDTL